MVDGIMEVEINIMKIEGKIKKIERKEYDDVDYEEGEKARKYLEGKKSELLEMKLKMKEMLKNFQKDKEEQKVTRRDCKIE